MKNIPLSYSFDDLLLVPQFSRINSRSEVDISSQISPQVKLKIPLISANMSDVTGVEMAISLGKSGGLGVIPRFKPPEYQAEEVFKVKKSGVLTAAAIGIRNGMFDRAEMLIKAGADILFLDVAHGHMQQVLEHVSAFKNKFKKTDLVAGNSATYQACYDLFKSGADCVKVGVGPGSICTTRIETGSGVPQMTAIFESARAARKFGKFIIADGGVKAPGDAVKALAGGASAVMAGSIFAGTDEAPGKLVTINGKKFKSYNASTSLAEKKNHVDMKADKFNKNYQKQIEGVESNVSYKGPVTDVLERYSHNIQSGLSYSGVRNIREFWNKAKFTQITSFGRRESEAHDVIVKP